MKTAVVVFKSAIRNPKSAIVAGCHAFAFVVLIMASASQIRGQDEEKIRKLFTDAIEAMGGDAYLKVSDVVSDGNFFFFDRDGDSSGLIKYNDYTKFPDKSRYELGNRKKEREITVFNLEKNEGWILEGQKETRDATPDEMKSFRNAVKHSIDNVLRDRWKQPENKLFYLGPGEGGDVLLEQVQILDPDNDTVTVFFDRSTRLPVKLEYKSTDKRGVHLREVDEFIQWHSIQGVKVPMRIDHFINGRKATQTFVIKITFNNNLPDSFFTKPLPPK
jgi:hypothetical protein